MMLGLSGVEQSEYESLVSAVEERALAVPGVDRIATAEMLPLGGGLQTTNWDIPGVEPPAGQEHLEIRYNVVSPSYFEVMGIPLTEGRPFAATDREGAEPVAIVSQAAARQYWPNGSPVGEEIRRPSRDASFMAAWVLRNRAGSATNRSRPAGAASRQAE